MARASRTAPVVPTMLDPAAIAAVLGHGHVSASARAYATHTLRHGGATADAREGAALAASLAELSQEIDDRLLALFRGHLARTVRSVSPLLVAACQREGLSLDALVTRMRPADDWPDWLCGPMPRTARRPGVIGMGSAMGVLMRPHDAGRVRRFLRSPLTVPLTVDPGGRLGLRAGRRCLELGLLTGLARIRSLEGGVTLHIRSRMPDTIVAALPDRALDAVVDHPLTNGMGYRIVEARAAKGGGTVIVFRARPLPWRVPWARPESGGGTTG